MKGETRKKNAAITAEDSPRAALEVTRRCRDTIELNVSLCSLATYLAFSQRSSASDVCCALFGVCVNCAFSHHPNNGKKMTSAKSARRESLGDFLHCLFLLMFL